SIEHDARPVRGPSGRAYRTATGSNNRSLAALYVEELQLIGRGTWVEGRDGNLGTIGSPCKTGGLPGNWNWVGPSAYLQPGGAVGGLHEIGGVLAVGSAGHCLQEGSVALGRELPGCLVRKLLRIHDIAQSLFVDDKAEAFGRCLAAVSAAVLLRAPGSAGGSQEKKQGDQGKWAKHSGFSVAGLERGGLGGQGKR